MRVPPLGYSNEEVVNELDKLRHSFRIALYRAKNGFNIGAIIRTAHSFLAKEIILVGDEPWYERAAMGMQKFEHIVEFKEDEAFLAHAEATGSPLVVFERDHATVGLWDAEIPRNAILVLGNEDVGVGERVIERAHEVVAIPMYGINHSYPVTIAAGIAMAEWARRYASTGVER